jgi:hypothetical protein
VRPHPRIGSVVALLAAALLGGLLGTVAFGAPASAAPPVYVVAGDDPAVTGDAWGFHESYFRELRAAITDPSAFGTAGTVRARFTIAPARPTPLTAATLQGIDVYFLSARDLSSGESQVLRDFVAGGGAVIVNSNGPDLFDDTEWLGLSLTPRVRFGDLPGDTTHRAPSPSSIVSAAHPLASGPFGQVGTFDNWHSVAGFSNAGSPTAGTVVARTTLTGPDTISGPPDTITLTNVATVVAFPARTLFGSATAGPVIAASDVDTFANAYTTAPNTWPGDAANTLEGTGNGILARNAFAWIAAQLTSLRPPESGFVPLVTPVRVLDTRSIGAFGPGESRQVSLAAAGVPADAEMVAINLTAVGPTSVGYLSAWPSGSVRPEVSTVNFVPGVTVANAAFVRLGDAGRFSIFNSAGTTDVLVDVTGYVASSTGSRFVDLTPARIKDTRTGLGGTGIAAGDTTQQLRVAGSGGVPIGATAVVLNVTAVDPTATAYVTVWPADRARPNVSSINTVTGTTVPNLVVVRLPLSGADAGTVDLYNAAGSTHLLVDVLGFYTDTAPIGAATPLDPYRAVDTRAGLPLGPGESRELDLGVFDAEGVIVNVTVASPTATGYLTVYPAGQARPDASNVNFYAGRSTPNLVMIRPTAGGRIRVYNSAGATHVLVDVIARIDT